MNAVNQDQPISMMGGLSCLVLNDMSKHVLKTAADIQRMSKELRRSHITQDYGASIYSAAKTTIKTLVFTMASRALTTLDLIPPDLEQTPNDVGSDYLKNISEAHGLTARIWIDDRNDDGGPMSCFVDGSFSGYIGAPDAAGIGIVLVNHKKLPVMAISGSLHAKSSIQAEISAIQLAHDICVQGNVDLRVIYTDCTHAIPQTSAVPICQHVKAHAGEWWNEIADGLASRGRSRSWLSLDPETIKNIATKIDDLTKGLGGGIGINIPQSTERTENYDQIPVQPEPDQPEPSVDSILPAYLEGRQMNLISHKKMGNPRSPVLFMSVPTVENGDYIVILNCSKSGKLTTINIGLENENAVRTMVKRLSGIKTQKILVARTTESMRKAVLIAQSENSALRFVRWNFRLPEIKHEWLDKLMPPCPAGEKHIKSFIPLQKIMTQCPMLAEAVENWRGPYLEDLP